MLMILWYSGEWMVSWIQKSSSENESLAEGENDEMTVSSVFCSSLGQTL